MEAKGRQIDVRDMVLDMVECLREPGALQRAVEAVARQCDQGYWTIENIRRGRAVKPPKRAVEGIRRGYARHCRNRAKRFIDRTERNGANVAVEDLVARARCVVEEIDAYERERRAA